MKCLGKMLLLSCYTNSYLEVGSQNLLLLAPAA